MNLRSRLLTAVVVSCVVAAALGFYVVMRESPEAARNRLLLDVLLLASLAGVVFAVTRAPLERREELLDAMRALTRGVRDRRLEPPERFGELEDLARSYNEVAAALSEHEDPNLGPVKAVPRQRRPAWMDPEASEHPELGEVRVIAKKPEAAPAKKKAAERASKAKARERDQRSEPAKPAWERKKGKKAAARASAEASAVDIEEQPVSELPRPAPSAPPAEEAAPEARTDEHARAEEDPGQEHRHEAREKPEAHAPERAHGRQTRAAAPDDDGNEVAVKAGTDDERDESVPSGDSDDRDQNGEHGLFADDGENDTAIDDLLRSEPARSAEEAQAEPARAADEELAPFDMRTLFREFVEAKRAHDEETDDLEYEAFAETLEDEMSRLVVAHGCRAVRFEVRIQDGEVSLLPRLLR